MLPKDNELSATTYEAKQVVCPLGLEIQKIHACPNDCILYRCKEYKNLDACPICRASLYKIRRDDPSDVEGERPTKKIPAKIMWYAPIIPRLKRLFRNKDHVKLLRWHKDMQARMQDEIIKQVQIAMSAQRQASDLEMNINISPPNQLKSSCASTELPNQDDAMLRFPVDDITAPFTSCELHIPKWNATIMVALSFFLLQILPRHQESMGQ